MGSTRRLDDDTPRPPSPPDVMSKSTNISQSKTKLTDSGSHRATSGPTPQGRPSPSAPAIADMASSRMHTSRDMLPYEPQTPSRGTAFESPHPPDEDRGKARPDEQGLTDPSAAQYGSPAPEEHTLATTQPPLQGSTDSSATLHRPPAPPEHIPATTEPPSSQQERNPSAIPHRLLVPPEHIPATTDPLTQPQPVSGPQLDRSNSHVQGNEGVDRAAEQAVGGPLPRSHVRKVIRRLVRPDEHENSLHSEILESQQISSRPNPTTSSEVRDGPVTAQPVPLGLYHPLAQNRRGDQLYGLTHAESRGGLPPPGQRRGLSKKKKDVGPSREVGLPQELGPREVELPLEPREGGRSPPGPRAQSPERRASFWCCC
jgi:hypothetical protein